jgi:hypothetical protein
MVRRASKPIFITFLVTLIIVFITGILLGRYLEQSAESELTDFLRENELNTESYLIEQALIKASGQDGCELAERRINDLSIQLGEIGQRLSMEDIDKILGEKNFNLMKRRYHLTQIRTYLLFEQLQDSCDLEQDVLLFYYGEDNGVSKAQGKILDGLVKDQGLIVFAIEYNYSQELTFIEYFYNITSTPTLVIGFNQTENSLVDKEKLVSLLQ